ncbi:Hypothetical Protein FCC1311_114132 [Hondaea fermentalgiana]|uniref:Uncharacterized protein n=1 Tax=Hondaea fermentalgiana TaxID=2315210 RepID=A0A2R5GWI4_9STRA|nr:Hypothetical Protein FCC1311_114132 [Hondaea fermentalgiana]|eukprot:GBG35190.1 Hypothetical Protein FCC1311_114132 [Hondaea fermentalgiana]
MVESMDHRGDLLMRATVSTGIDLRDDAHNDEDTIEQACETIGEDNATQIASNDSQAMISLRDGRSDMPEYVLAVHHVLPADPQGWARRPHHGSAYGSDYMGPYRERVEELLGLGVENSSHKMGPGVMRAQLEKEFPGQSCLPSKERIKLLIGQLSTQQKAREQAERMAMAAKLAWKDAVAAAVMQSGSSGKGRKGMEAKFTNEVQLLTVTNPSKTLK